jgi:hypothetical protein
MEPDCIPTIDMQTRGHGDGYVGRIDILSDIKE